MDYEKKYKEALAKAKEQYNYPCMRSCMGILEEIFPELTESEDEKIRKAILDYLTIMWGNSQDDVCGVHVEDAMAWLENIPYTIDHEKREGFHLGYKAGFEKQGEQNTKHKIVFVKFICKKDWHGIGDYCYGKVYNGYPCEKEQKGYDVYDDNNIPTFCDEDFINEYFRIITEEKQDEQKPAWSEEELTDFEKSLKHVMEETLECGDIHNLKADADLLLRLVKPTDEDMKEALRTEYEKGRADVIADTLSWLANCWPRYCSNQTIIEGFKEAIKD